MLIKGASIVNKIKQNPLLYLFGKTWHYSFGNRKNVVFYWILFLVGNAIALIFKPLTMAIIMDTIQKQGVTRSNFTTLVWLLVMMLVINLLFWGFHGPGRVIETINAFKVRANYQKHLLKGTMVLPLEWHTEHHSGDTIDKVEKGTSALYGFSQSSFMVISAVIQLAVSYVMLVYVSRPAAYMVLVMIFVAIWITMRFDRVLISQYEALNHAENNISESVYDAISNITTVIILRVERLIFGAIVKKIMDPFQLFKKDTTLNEMKWSITSVCCTMMTVVVLGTYFWQHIGTSQGISVGKVYLLVSYLDTISDLFFRFTDMYGDILRRKAKVLNAEEIAKDFGTENFSNHVLPPSWQCICVGDLNFSYPSSEDTDAHLKDISLAVRRGERIAFVGESGSGKTTLLKIFRNLYHPQTLRLTVDGEPIHQGFEGISRAIALVPQDPEIFATTILENITLGAEYDPATLRQFIDMACFTEVVESLPHKLDSSIKEKGVNLSGGQQQRLALARGLLACQDKSIVLLDEPTSSIDLLNEMRIYQNIFREFADKAVISSIHRLHLLPLFHRIYVFDEGRIIGAGTLDELLATCPEFQELWQQYRECRQVDQQ